MRYILHTKAGDYREIHCRTSERGFIIPSEGVEAISKLRNEQIVLRDLMATVDTIVEPKFKQVCLSAYAMAYTPAEIYYELKRFRHRCGRKSTIGVQSIKRCLGKGILKKMLREGRGWNQNAVSYVQNGFKIGLKAEHICHQLHTHGYHLTEEMVKGIKVAVKREGTIKTTLPSLLPKIEFLSLGVTNLPPQDEPAECSREDGFSGFTHLPDQAGFEESSDQWVSHDAMDFLAQGEMRRDSSKVGHDSEWAALDCAYLPAMGSPTGRNTDVESSRPGVFMDIGDFLVQTEPSGIDSNLDLSRGGQ